MSKSDEFSDLTHIVIEILRCEIFTFSIHTSINRSMSPIGWRACASSDPARTVGSSQPGPFEGPFNRAARLTARIAQDAMPLVEDEADLVLQVVSTSEQLCLQHAS